MFDEVRYRELRGLSVDMVGGWIASHAEDVDALDANGKTLLHDAIDANVLPVVMALADSVADIDQRDRWGNTPLWRAMYHMPESAGVAEFLIARGADPDIKNNHDISPRDLATDPNDLLATAAPKSDPAAVEPATDEGVGFNSPS